MKKSIILLKFLFLIFLMFIECIRKCGAFDDYYYEEGNYNNFKIKLNDETCDGSYLFLKSVIIRCSFINETRTSFPDLNKFLNSYKSYSIYLIIENKNYPKIGDYAFQNFKIEKLELRTSKISLIEINSLIGLENILEYLNLRENKLNQSSLGFIKKLPSLKYLDLGSNEIELLPDFIFSNLKKLTQLKLDLNRISFIEKNAFVSLESGLIYLDLKDNRIESVNSSLRLLGKLNYLNLNLNSIKLVENELLYHLVFLTDFYSSDNELSEFDSISNKNNTFNLRKLVLKSNKFERIKTNAFIQMKKLEYLDLSINQINCLETNAFNGLISLKKLFLANNFLKNFSFVNENLLIKLDELDLSYNLIEYLNEYSFSSLISLNKINLESNKIKYIELMTFNRLTYLFEINLNNNELRKCTRNTFNIDSLKSVNLEGNLIESIESDCFNSKLKNFYLNSNRIQNFSFENLNLITTLELYDNLILRINKNMFKNLNSLSNLDLKRNKISVIEMNSFSTANSQLSKIDLSENSLYLIESSLFRNLKKLYMLIFSNNKILKIQIYAFDGLEKCLTVLDLSYNKLKVIKSYYFSGLIMLQNLSINNNRLSSLNKDSFRSLVNLRNLNLENNCLFHIHSILFERLGMLKVLRLNSNRIYKLDEELFKNLNSLDELYLNSNKLTNVLLSNGLIRNLKSLDLSDNYLGNLDFLSSFKNSNIRRLNLASNQFKQVNLTIGNLDDLDLSNNFKLESIDISKCSLIRILNINNNKKIRIIDFKDWYFLSEFYAGNISNGIFSYFTNLYSLSKFDLSYNYDCQINKINLSKLARLSYLNLSNVCHSMFFDTDLFNKLKMLNYLDFSNTKISFNSGKLLLKENTNIKMLILENCSIETLDSFKFEISLKHLSLKLNRISIIKKNYFFKNENLLYLDLSFNQIEFIEKNSFHQMNFPNLVLVNLFLNNNRLRSFNSKFLTILNLKIDKISLESNQLIYLNSHVDMTSLNLAENNLNESLLALKNINLKLTRELYLCKNSISKIDNQLFSSSSNLELLDLSWNKISLIENEAFDYLRSLKKLDLSKNYLRNLFYNSSLFENQQELIYLNLSFNLIDKINFNLFQNLRLLEILDLSNNRILTIDDYSFKNLNYLKEIYLNHNLRLNFCQIFNGLDNIEKIYLDKEFIIQLISTPSFLDYMKDSIKLRQTGSVNLDVTYFHSVNLIYDNGFSNFLTKQDCLNKIQMLKVKFHLNLLTDFHLEQFVFYCKSYNLFTKY